MKRYFRLNKKSGEWNEIPKPVIPQGIPHYPIMPDSAALSDPSQIPEQIAYDIAMGVPTEYTPIGQPIITSRSHYKKYCRANQLFQRNGGYGESPRNR